MFFSTIQKFSTTPPSSRTRDVHLTTTKCRKSFNFNLSLLLIHQCRHQHFDNSWLLFFFAVFFFFFLFVFLSFSPLLLLSSLLLRNGVVVQFNPKDSCVRMCTLLVVHILDSILGTNCISCTSCTEQFHCLLLHIHWNFSDHTSVTALERSMMLIMLGTHAFTVRR